MRAAQNQQPPRALRRRAITAITGLHLIGTLMLVATADAQVSTIGRTWPIAEPDAMTEIEARTASLPPNMAAKFGPRAGWQALQAASLGVAKIDRTRSIVPFHTLDSDIRLPDGRLLYPKGFTFNPLAFVTLPQRLVVVDRRDLDWALHTARPTDFILLTAGRAGEPDVLTLADRTKRPLFILEERVKSRLGLTVAPVVVSQSGQKLLLTEYGPRAHRPAAKDRPS